MYATDIPMYRRRLAAGLVGLIILAGSAVSQQSFAQTLIDYDTDDDNLIEVDSLAKLNAIRYDLRGIGMPSNMSAYAEAFPTPAPSMGCAATCRGYELTTDLDFDTDGNPGITEDDGVLSWGEGADAGNGWEPMGADSEGERVFTRLNGNGHTISHLFINRTDSSDIGLIGYLGSGAIIQNVGLVGVNVTGRGNVGGLVGRSDGSIRESYVTGDVRGENNNIGVLVGQCSSGNIRASYATGVVSGAENVGGLVGASRGIIDASYATGVTTGTNNVGGLVGQNIFGTIRASYANVAVSGDSNLDGLVGLRIGGSGNFFDNYFDSDTFGSTATESKTTAELQEPTGYDGIYANWNVDGDEPWHFGASDQYPILQVDFNGDGVKSWQEFGPQSRPGVLVLPVELSLTEGTMETYTVVLLTTPTATVTVTPVSPSSEAVSVSGELTFTDGDWDMEQTVTVSAEVDDNSVGEMVSLTNTVTESSAGNYASAAASNVRVNVTDNTPGVAVLPVELLLLEGTTGSYTVVLLIAPTATVTVTPMSSNTTAVSIVSSDTMLTFTESNWNRAQTVTVSAEEEDDNVIGRMVSLMHTVGESSAGNYASVTAPDVTVNVTDNDTPVAVSTGTLSLTEGTTGSYTVVLLGRPTTPSVTVTPVVTAVLGNTAAVSVSGPLTFTDTNWDTRQTVTVSAEDDDNAVDEEVMLTHTVSESPNYASMPPPVVVTVNVEDDDGGIRVRVRVFLEGPLR